MSSDLLPSQLAIRQILDLLPHRYPFMLVDRVTELCPGLSVKAYKCVSFNEPFFQGHFPELPVMPGVLIIEALAQASALIVLGNPELSREEREKYLCLFTGIEKVRFRRPVYPGDRLDMESTLIRHKLKLWKMDCRAHVNGQLAAEAQLTAAITDRSDMQ